MGSNEDLDKVYRDRYNRLCDRRSDLEAEKKKYEDKLTALKKEKTSILGWQDDLVLNREQLQNCDMSAGGAWCGKKASDAEVLRTQIVSKMKTYNGKVDTLNYNVDEAIRMVEYIVESYKEQLMSLETEILSAAADCNS